MSFVSDDISRPQHVMKDVVANLLGKGWVAFVSVAFVPFFLKFLGVEAYGLVGFFLTLQTILLLLDFGFSTALNRQLSAYTRTVIPADAVYLASALERIFAAFSLLISLLLLFVSPWLVAKWIVLDNLAAPDVENALRLMGVAIALQLPFLLYAGGLYGLGRQLQVNAILAICATLRYGGALLVLMASPKIESFFMWQIFAVAVQTLWARGLFFRVLRDRPVKSYGKVDPFRKHIGFAAGVGMTAILGVVLTQLDKLMLSKLLSLGEYGNYMLAWTLSSMLFMLAGPVVTAFFPRLAAEVARTDGDPATPYHSGCQLLSIVVIPAGVLLILLPSEVLMLWIGEFEVARHVGSLVALLALGSLLNTLAQLPHALQLAFGKPHFGLYTNLLLIMLTIPALYVGVERAGAQGAAWVWVMLNGIYVIVGIPVMHRWLLRGHFLRWLWRDVILPLLVAFVVILLMREWMALQPSQSMYNFVMLMSCYVGAVLLSLIVTSDARRYLFAWRHAA